MNEQIIINRKHIEDEKINDEVLLLIILLSSKIEHDSSDINYVDMYELLDCIINKNLTDSIRKEIENSFKKLEELNIINNLEEFEDLKFKFSPQSLKYVPFQCSYVRIFLSDIIKICHNIKYHNLYKMIRIYVNILTYADFSSKLPKNYKFKVYHLGRNYLIKKSGINPLSYQEYINFLQDNRIIYLTREKHGSSGFNYNYISRYEDKDICNDMAFIGSQELAKYSSKYKMISNLLC